MSEEWTPEKIETRRVKTADSLGANLGTVRSLKPLNWLIVTPTGLSFSVLFETFKSDLVCSYLCKDHCGNEYVAKVPDDDSSVEDQLRYSVAQWIAGDSTRIDAIWDNLAKSDRLPPHIVTLDDVKRDIGNEIKKIDVIPPNTNYSGVTTFVFTVFMLK